MPPLNRSIVDLEEETGITSAILYNRRKQARSTSVLVPRDGKQSDAWPSAVKLRLVLETSGLGEMELAEYCRRKGLYEQFMAGRIACEKHDGS